MTYPKKRHSRKTSSFAADFSDLEESDGEGESEPRPSTSRQSHEITGQFLNDKRFSALNEFNHIRHISSTDISDLPATATTHRHSKQNSLGSLSATGSSATRPRSRPLSLGAYIPGDSKTSTQNRQPSFGASTVDEGVEGRSRPTSKRVSWATAERDRPRSIRTLREECYERDPSSRPPSGLYTLDSLADSELSWTAGAQPQASMTHVPILTPLNVAQTRDRLEQPEMCWYTDLIPMIYQPQARVPAFIIYPEWNQAEAVGRHREGAVDEDEAPEYLGPLPLAFLLVGVCLAVFLISLDRTIITTAIPKITDDFNSYNDIGWYGSGYLVTACAFQPLYGRIYTRFDIRWSFLAAVATFGLGSLICATAPSSNALIIGRAIAGCGSAGILTGSFVVVAHSVPMEKRPVLTAAVGLMFGVGATVGPLLGGVFTDLVSWRWCFYINLPIAAITFVTMIFCFKSQTKKSILIRPFVERLLDLDLLGSAVLLAACIQFFIALQYNGQGESWSSSVVLGTLLGSIICLALFLYWQWRQGDAALMPPRVLFQRSVAASCFIAFFLYAGMLVHAYYLPIWFQAIQGASAINSGVRMIPYMVANALFSLFAGITVAKTGYFMPPAVIGCAIATIGCALFTTLEPSESSAKWIGFEILSAAGFGMAIQQGFTAVQSVLDMDDVPIGVAAVTAFQSLGGAVFVAVGNDVLQSELRKHNIPGININAVIEAGATEFRSIVDPTVLPLLVSAYNKALQKVFVIAIPLAILALVGALGLEFRSILQKSPPAREVDVEQVEARLDNRDATSRAEEMKDDEQRPVTDDTEQSSEREHEKRKEKS